MNRYFAELLDFMIPKIGNGLSGSYVWKSDQDSYALEARFLTSVEIRLLNEVQVELAVHGSSPGSYVYQLLQTSDKPLLKDVGNRLIEHWFTHPEVLTFYGLTPEAVFPHGKKLTATDWSILEPVFLRGKLYRG